MAGEKASRRLIAQLMSPGGLVRSKCVFRSSAQPKSAMPVVTGRRQRCTAVSWQAAYACVLHGKSRTRKTGARRPGAMPRSPTQMGESGARDGGLLEFEAKMRCRNNAAPVELGLHRAQCGL